MSTPQHPLDPEAEQEVGGLARFRLLRACLLFGPEPQRHARVKAAAQLADRGPGRWKFVRHAVEQHLLVVDDAGRAPAGFCPPDTPV